MSIRPAPWSAHTFSAHLVAALVTAFSLAQPASAQAPASQSLPGTAAPAETRARVISYGADGQEGGEGANVDVSSDQAR